MMGMVSETGVGAGLARRPVLVVDDDKDIRETLQELIEDEGYEVLSARNGLEALERIQERRPGLVVLDLFMPGMDGAEFRRRQLADPRVSDVPVVVISAAAGLEERVAAMRPAAHLEKPIRLEDLLRLVERFCG
jgi:CheY-like chemotaxis protein